MTDALAAWEAKALSEPITLPSGTIVQLRLPDIKSAIIRGELSFSVVRYMAGAIAESKEKDEPPPEFTPEEMKTDDELDMQMGAAAVATVDGDEVELTSAQFRRIPPADRKEIMAYCSRGLTVPKVETG